MKKLLIGLALALPAAYAVDPGTLEGKVLFGYQGWFNCAGDGSPENNWRSWSRGAPAADTLTIDMYPDLREFARGRPLRRARLHHPRAAGLPLLGVESQDRRARISGG